MITDVSGQTGDDFESLNFQGKLNYIRKQFPNMTDEQKSVIPDFILQELGLA